MSNAIHQRTRELYEKRMARRQAGHLLRPEVPRLNNRLLTETSTMSSIAGMDYNIRNARLHGHNTNVGKGIWSLSSRIPAKPYQPKLADTYPRDPFTMMPQQPQAPKYYGGQFWSFDHKDTVQQDNEGSFNEGRNVVFNAQNIEKVQTKKKYGDNLKGQSSVPLHLCNDTTSELFQRSLNPNGVRDRSHLSTAASRASEVSELKAIVDKYPDVRLHKTKNQTSVLNPLGPALTTQRWIDTAYPTSSHGRHYDAISEMDNERMRPRRYSIKSEPEWYSSLFPKQKVADAMKFMGKSQAVIHRPPGKGKEYDINFNGNS